MQLPVVLVFEVEVLIHLHRKQVYFPMHPYLVLLEQRRLQQQQQKVREPHHLRTQLEGQCTMIGIIQF